MYVYKRDREYIGNQVKLEGLIVIDTLAHILRVRQLSFKEKLAFIFHRFVGRIHKIYILVESGMCIHISHVIGKGIRTPFMEHNDILIGPCWTHPQYRGKGIYPRVLQQIINHYYDRNKWIVCRKDNIQSLQGISKAGFKLEGFVVWGHWPIKHIQCKKTK